MHALDAPGKVFLSGSLPGTDVRHLFSERDSQHGEQGGLGVPILLTIRRRGGYRLAASVAKVSIFG